MVLEKTSEDSADILQLALAADNIPDGMDVPGRLPEFEQGKTVGRNPA
jgi:hypothetical protein